MKIEINNRGEGDEVKVVLEPSPIKGLINLKVLVIDYSGGPGKRVNQAEAVVDAQDLKAGVDSVVKVCGKKV